MSTHSQLTGTEIHQPFHFIQETDPGAVGPNLWWARLSTGIVKVRNLANSAWIVQLPGSTALVDPTTTKGDLISRSSVIARLPVGSNGQVLTADSAQTLGIKWAASGAIGSDYILIRDQKASGTDGGTNSTGWQTRVLNTTVLDTGSFSTLASNQIALLAGTYRAHILVPAYAAGSCRARLRNITGSSTTLLSNQYYDPVAASVSSVIMPIIGQFTIGSTTTFEVQMYSDVSTANNGNGLSIVAAGELEVYTIASFIR